MTRPAKMARGRATRAAERRVDYHSVCLIGFADGIVPRYMGDNLGSVPVRVVACKKERTAAQKYDLSQPIHHVQVLESVVVETEAHAKRLKAALDYVLHGESRVQDNSGLRHQWCDVRGCFSDEFGRQMWWGIVLDQALSMCRQQATQFGAFDSAKREEKVARARPGGRLRR